MDSQALMKELRDLERMLDKRFTDLSDKIHDVSERLSIDIASLKATAFAYGSVAGFIPSMVFFLLDFLKKG